MKKLSFLSAALVVAFFIAASSTAQADLANAGFENWVDYEGSLVPDNWWHMFGDPDVTGVRSTTAHTESYSAQATVSGSGWGGWGQWLSESVNTGDVFDASVYINIPTGMINAEAVLEVGFKDASGNLIGSAFTATRSTATSGWETLSLTTGFAPSDAVSISYSVLARDAGASPSGTVYFDDASGVLVPEPASFLLLGLGLAGIFVVRRKKG